MRVIEGVLARAHRMKEMTPRKPVGLTQPQPYRRADRARYVGAKRGAKLRELELSRTNLVEQAGSRQKAKNAIKRRGMGLRFRGQVIAMLWPGKQQVGNSELHGNVQGLRNAISANELEDLAEILWR